MTQTGYIAWDLDGTLVDMDYPHFKALNDALAAVCGPQAPITEGEHQRTFKGLPTTRKLDTLVGLGRIPAGSRAEVAALKQRLTIDAIRATLRPQPEKLAVLGALKADGWHQCVCSNAVRTSVYEMLLASGLLRFMEFYLSNQDAPSKPDPGMYLMAARLWHVMPEQIVAVEDAAPGQASARAAGCRLVEIAGPEDVAPGLILPRLLDAGHGGRVLARFDEAMLAHA